MARWLYRYVFRGIGLAFLIGVITALYLMIVQFHQLAQNSGPASRSEATAPATRAPNSGSRR